MLSLNPDPLRGPAAAGAALGRKGLNELPLFFRSFLSNGTLHPDLAYRIQNFARFAYLPIPEDQQYSLAHICLQLSTHKSGRTFLAENLEKLLLLPSETLSNLRVRLSSEHHLDFYPMALLQKGLKADLLIEAGQLSPQGIALWLANGLSASSGEPAVQELAGKLRSQIKAAPLKTLVFNVLGLPGPGAILGIEKLTAKPAVKKMLGRLGLMQLTRLGERERARFEISRDAMAQLDPDIVLLQEMWHAQTKLLRKSLENAGLTCYSGIKSHGLIKRSGLHTYSRFPIDRSHEHVFSRSVFRELIHSTEELFVDKGFLLTAHQVPGIGEVNYINTHLLARPPAFRRVALPEEGRFSLRHRQINEIFSVLDTLVENGAAVIVAGDFNLDEKCAQYGVLREKLGTDLYRLRYPNINGARICDSVVTESVRAGLTLDHTTNLTRPDLLRPQQRPDMAFLLGLAPAKYALRVRVCMNNPPSSDHFALLFELLPIS